MPLSSTAQHSRGRLTRLLMGAAAASLGALAYAYWIEPGWIELRRITLMLPRLTPAFDGYRIAQLSDIHMNGFMTAERLTAIAALINQQRPDLMVLTGDFVTREAENYFDRLVPALRCLAPRDGTVAILGNHDHYGDADVIHRVIRDSGLIDLSNTVYSVRRGGERLYVCGVDDVCVGEDRLDRVLDVLPDDGAAILLVHEPDFADVSALSGRFDLQISGHSHGGQVRIPFWGRRICHASPGSIPPGSIALA